MQQPQQPLVDKLRRLGKTSSVEELVAGLQAAATFLDQHSPTSERTKQVRALVDNLQKLLEEAWFLVGGIACTVDNMTVTPVTTGKPTTTGKRSRDSQPDTAKALKPTARLALDKDHKARIACLALHSAPTNTIQSTVYCTITHIHLFECHQSYYRDVLRQPLPEIEHPSYYTVSFWHTVDAAWKTRFKTEPHFPRIDADDGKPGKRFRQEDADKLISLLASDREALKRDVLDVAVVAAHVDPPNQSVATPVGRTGTLIEL